MTQDFKKLKKKFCKKNFVKLKKKDIFVLLVTFEILSHYPNIDSSHWLKEDVQLITDKIFLKKFWFKWLRHVPLAFFY